MHGLISGRRHIHLVLWEPLSLQGASEVPFPSRGWRFVPHISRQPPPFGCARSASSVCGTLPLGKFWAHGEAERRHFSDFPHPWGDISSLDYHSLRGMQILGMDLAASRVIGWMGCRSREKEKTFLGLISLLV